YKEGTSWKRRFWNNLRTNLIIILASSLLLMEGYVCVIMAMPLFILITIVAFISAYIWNTYGKGSPKSYILPAIMILASFEGTTPEFSFNRYNAVTYTQTVNLDAATIKERIQQPIKFKGNRHWLLSVFPMPVHVDTVKLKEGEIRKYDFIYHRWFITNTKVGSVEVKFREIGENRIKTEITDTSYISGYMKLHGTEFNLTPLNEHQTQVSLTVYFDRTLDPIWYYGPLERFAVQKGIKYFINEVLAEKSGENI
ncbi:MAG: hypothetical protein KDC56_12880, partial [Flavobacteriaceae bacterium]|nr:hypothetical protein [Flavobacteriaceae bacterium]